MYFQTCSIWSILRLIFTKESGLLFNQSIQVYKQTIWTKYARVTASANVRSRGSICWVDAWRYANLVWCQWREFGDIELDFLFLIIFGFGVFRTSYELVVKI